MEDTVDNTQDAFPGAAGSDEGDQQRSSASGLREALRALASASAGGAGPANLSPQTLEDLARRAGVPGGAGELARLLGRESMAGPVAASGPQYLVFAVGGVECCVPTETVQGVERITDLASVPNTAPWVLGVVQWRGSIISVVDLGAYLGLPPDAPGNRTRLLVMSYRGMTIGLIVDAVLEMRADSSGMRPASDYAPPGWIEPYTSSVLQLGDRRIVVVDAQQLLFADKMQRYRADDA
jgi:purine-binding chemotaxis protein CheW